jgi:hypothetical protein
MGARSERVLIVGGGIAGLALGAAARAHGSRRRGGRARTCLAAVGCRHLPARRRHSCPARSRARSAGCLPGRRDPTAAVRRPPGQAAVRGRRRRAVGGRRAVPRVAASRAACPAPGGCRRRAHSPGAGRRKRRSARWWRLGRVRRRNQRGVRPRGRSRWHPQRRAPPRVRPGGGAQSRWSARLALRGPATCGGHHRARDLAEHGPGRRDGPRGRARAQGLPAADPGDPRRLMAFEARRRPRLDWVRARTHRRDRTRYLPPAMRDTVLRSLGRRIFHADYRPLLDPP